MDYREVTTEDYQLTARKIVADWIKKQYKEEADITEHDVVIVTSCKTLQHWKATLYSKCRKDMYFEITLNGDKKAAYLNAYRKEDNVVYFVDCV